MSAVSMKPCHVHVLRSGSLAYESKLSCTEAQHVEWLRGSLGALRRAVRALDSMVAPEHLEEATAIVVASFACYAEAMESVDVLEGLRAPGECAPDTSPDETATVMAIGDAE